MILRDTTRLARFLAGWLVLTSALLTHTAEAGTGSAGTFFPKPGTYTLHKIQKAPTGWVLEESFWRPRRLSSYVGSGAVLYSRSSTQRAQTYRDARSLGWRIRTSRRK